MKKTIVISALVAVFLQCGCGFVGLMGTPGRHEIKIPAEYDLAERDGQKMLVLVEQPGWLNTSVNLRYYLTKAIREELTAKIEIPLENLVDYSELSEFRSAQPDFSFLSPVEVGAALNTDMVLLVIIRNYQLNEMYEKDYYNGFLGAQAVLFETSTGEKLWPDPAKSKSIRVGFDVEEKGRAVAGPRLATASSHCLVRYFYDCPKDEFKIADDRSGAWENW